MENSIEQKILELQNKKQAIQNGIFGENTEDDKLFSGDDLVELLRLK